MVHEEDFVNDEIIEFNLDNKKFKYSLTTVEQELDWTDEYIKIVDGKVKQDLKELQKCKILNIIEVPYDKEIIKKITGIDKDWKLLNKNERWELFKKLKPRTYDKIITRINQLEESDNEVKKK